MNVNETSGETYEDNYSIDRGRLKWTIMVYLAGDNNLSANSISILQELEAAACSSQVRVLACYDSNSPVPQGARYLEIQHGRHNSTHRWDWGLHNDIAYPDEDIAVSPDFCNPDPSTVSNVYEPTAREGLSRFLGWALRNHPAEHYMLILFGHGVLVAGNTFLADDAPPSFLRLKDFTRIIKRYFRPTKGTPSERRKPHLDILACDNCVMNGVEAAYEIKDHVDYVIGSQDLMLAVGWPFKRIIEVVQNDPTASPKKITRRILKACARRLLDYSLMDRSSEQAVCDLKKLGDDRFTHKMRELAHALKAGLETDACGHVCYPEVRDAVRLARLEAQSYWDESFVDLYDFCELMLKRCNKFLDGHWRWFKGFEEHFKVWPPKDEVVAWVNTTETGSHFERIHKACLDVLSEFKLGDEPGRNDQSHSIVPYSYYVCPDLQYSHGLSIYFPWTLPQDTIYFEPHNGYPSYPAECYDLKTAFDEYKEYDFAKPDGADWAGFLVQFFRATLRNVRLVDFGHEDAETFEATTAHEAAMAQEAARRHELTIALEAVRENAQFSVQAMYSPDGQAPVIDLQKSGPDTGEQDERTRLRIKNYPRRFYLSPEDCANRCKPCATPTKPDLHCYKPEIGTPAHVYKHHRVSYLGWAIRGILREVINWPRDSAADDPTSENTRDFEEDCRGN